MISKGFYEYLEAIVQIVEQKSMLQKIVFV